MLSQSAIRAQMRLPAQERGSATLISQSALRAQQRSNMLKEKRVLEEKRVRQVREEERVLKVLDLREGWPELESFDVEVASITSTTLSDVSTVAFQPLKTAKKVVRPCPCCTKTTHSLLECPIYKYQHKNIECRYCHVMGHMIRYKGTVVCPRITVAYSEC